MKTRTIHLLTGICFTLAGTLSLLDGVYHARGSNIFIGICFALVGYLYFRRRKEMQ